MGQLVRAPHARPSGGTLRFPPHLRAAGIHPRELSFKHTVQMWTTWSWRARELFAAPEEFFRLLAQHTVGKRPGRIEPRARKRRPKSFPWLKVPRSLARRQIRAHGHLLSA